MGMEECMNSNQAGSGTVRVDPLSRILAKMKEN